ncbi:MAG: ABC transporter substrate-binding protein [Planctomycetaceae bacterium]|nr:ABC transporter substrate-binding protein [Planctomycetaceae bacterium]
MFNFFTNKHHHRLALFTIALCLLISGCQKKTPEASPSNNTNQPYPRTVTDELKRSVTIKAPPQRIISLSPSNTEFLFALGLGDRVVGVTHLCDYPEGALEKEKVGDFSANTISMERIVSLKPDLVVSGAGFHQELIANLEKVEVTVLAVEPKQFEQIYARIKLLGHVCDVEERAEELVNELQSRVELIRKKSTEIKPDPPLKVFYQIWNDPLSSTGDASFIGEMLQTVQVQNVFSDLNTGYSPINEEALITKNPDLFLVPMYHGGEKDREQILSNPNWQNIEAIKNNRVVFLPDDEVSRHGPRFVEGLEAIFHACYPEAKLE